MGRLRWLALNGPDADQYGREIVGFREIVA